MKFWCKLLGHDFDRHWEEVFHAATTWVYRSEKCLRCGVDIHDVYTISPGGSVDYEYKKKEKEKEKKK